MRSGGRRHHAGMARRPKNPAQGDLFAPRHSPPMETRVSMAAPQAAPQAAQAQRSEPQPASAAAATPAMFYIAVRMTNGDVCVECLNRLGSVEIRRRYGEHRCYLWRDSMLVNGVRQPTAKSKCDVCGGTFEHERVQR